MEGSVEGPASEGEGKGDGEKTAPRVERRGVKDIFQNEMLDTGQSCNFSDGIDAADGLL